MTGNKGPILYRGVLKNPIRLFLEIPKISQFDKFDIYVNYEKISEFLYSFNSKVDLNGTYILDINFLSEVVDKLGIIVLRTKPVVSKTILDKYGEKEFFKEINDNLKQDFQFYTHYITR